jgi:hypothetical protein
MNTPQEPTVRARTAQPFEKARISGHPPGVPDARTTVRELPSKADTVSNVVVDYSLALIAANEDIPDANALDFEAALRVRAAVTGWDAYDIWHGRIRLAPGATSLFVSSS